jgi:eukaryotic-like serine/threonine-protein kinase
MTPERWQQIERLYQAALEREAKERSTFLDQACGGDKEVRQEVESLLAREQPATSFMETPALEEATKNREKPPFLLGQQLGSYRIL